jgi:hypothetical protein
MDVEKTMQFIREQNAQNTIQIAKLREVVVTRRSSVEGPGEWKLKMAQMRQDLATLRIQGSATPAIQNTVLAEKIAELAEMQKTTKENLNILVRTVQELSPRLPNQ